MEKFNNQRTMKQMIISKVRKNDFLKILIGNTFALRDVIYLN
jgi:hypothetical protein